MGFSGRLCNGQTEAGTGGVPRIGIAAEESVEEVELVGLRDTLALVRTVSAGDPAGPISNVTVPPAGECFTALSIRLETIRSSMEGSPRTTVAGPWTANRTPRSSAVAWNRPITRSATRRRSTSA
jgi:hypothetical protein